MRRDIVLDVVRQCLPGDDVVAPVGGEGAFDGRELTLLAVLLEVTEAP